MNAFRSIAAASLFGLLVVSSTAVQHAAAQTKSPNHKSDGGLIDLRDVSDAHLIDMLSPPKGETVFIAGYKKMIVAELERRVRHVSDARLIDMLSLSDRLSGERMFRFHIKWELEQRERDLTRQALNALYQRHRMEFVRAHDRLLHLKRLVDLRLQRIHGKAGLKAAEAKARFMLLPLWSEPFLRVFKVETDFDLKQLPNQYVLGFAYMREDDTVVADPDPRQQAALIRAHERGDAENASGGESEGEGDSD